MKNSNLISAILAATALAAVPALAAADRNDYRGDARLVKLGEVDTHADDPEDYVPVSPARRYDSIVIQARDGVVPLSGVKVQYSDGRIEQPFGNTVLRPGERVVFDVPSSQPIKMLVLDYNERRSSRMGDRASARVEVFAQNAERPRYRDRDRGDRYDRYDRGYDHDRVNYDRTPRYEWRGNVRVRIN